MRGVRKVLLGAVLAGGFVLVAGSAAGAQMNQASRPAAVGLGDPVGTNVSPHGGYSPSTGMCMQCHSVHGGYSSFGIFRKRSIDTLASATGVCRTCHTIEGVAPTSKGNGYGAPGYVAGTTATRAAYQNDTPRAEHPLGAMGGGSIAAITRSGWAYRGTFSTDSTEVADTDTSAGGVGGLYCGSCHTAHGDSGQLVNNWQSPANDNAAISWNPLGARSWRTGYLHLDTSRAVPATAGQTAAARPGVWQACTAPDGVTGCEDLIVDTSDNAGNAAGDGAYLYGYKLLSASPNHAYGPTQPWGETRPKTFNAASYGHDVMTWCQTCHVSKTETKLTGSPAVRVLDTTKHMHPTACTACHGNPNTPAAGGVADFPHTSTNENFLKDYPDALCLSCHTSGSLP